MLPYTPGVGLRAAAIHPWWRTIKIAQVVGEFESPCLTIVAAKITARKYSQCSHTCKCGLVLRGSYFRGKYRRFKPQQVLNNETYLVSAQGINLVVELHKLG